ncbi:MAG: LCP family protein, partial [Egibacteraceae bacterium]
IKDADAKIDLPAGCVTLQGSDALGFVRVRKIDSDFGRVARQQRFIREIVEQLTSARVAFDIPRLFSLVEAAARAVDADESLSLNDMRRLAFSLRNLTSDKLGARTVPAFDRMINGVAYVVADEAKAEQLYTAFRTGVAAPAGLGRQTPGTVKVDDVPPVAVLNGTNQEGLAETVSTALQERGFQVATTANAELQDLRRSEVRHGPQQREEAVLLSRAMGGTRIVLDPDLDTPTVVLGTDTEVEAVRDIPPQPLPEPEEAPTFAGAGADADRDC